MNVYYKSKFTGVEIDQRLAQGTYDDAVKAGFIGTKEEFDQLTWAFGKEQQQKLETAQQQRDDDLETESKNIVEAINEINLKVNEGVDQDQLKSEISKLQNTINSTKIELQESINTESSERKSADTDLSNRIAAIENADYQTGTEVDDRINEIIGAAPEALDTLKEIADALNNDPNFAVTITNELNKKLDSDKLLSGAGISIREEEGKKIVDIAEDALTKIQYADNEVRRLEQDKIAYAYDEKTQSNINVILPEGGSYLGNYGDENATIAKAAVYDGTKQLEIGSSKVHTNINTLDNLTVELPEGKRTVMLREDELPSNEVRVPVRSLKDQVYSKEDILGWFGVEDVIALKNKIVREGQLYFRFGIQLSGNPMYYKMPVDYIAFESANQIKLVFLGLDTSNDKSVKYTIIMNLDGTIIEGNSNVKVTITSIEPKDIDLSTYATKEELNDYALKSEIPDISNLATVATSGDYNDLTNTPDLTVYQTITDNSLVTSAKTIPAAINEIKESVESISDPYEINLTNLLSAEDSESISTVIGGIDNLNNTVQDNRIIVGTISNGNVSVSIRILGNVTTLYYLLDSVVGLTLNEVTITNTSGTLSKSVTTHSVLTENMVINSLESNEATLPLSAAQGKILATDKQSKIDNNLSTTDKTIVGAINELLTKVQELEIKNTESESRLAALEEGN